MTGNFRYFYLSKTVASFEKAYSIKPIFTKGKERHPGTKRTFHHSDSRCRGLLPASHSTLTGFLPGPFHHALAFKRVRIASRSMLMAAIRHAISRIASKRGNRNVFLGSPGTACSPAPDVQTRIEIRFDRIRGMAGSTGISTDHFFGSCHWNENQLRHEYHHHPHSQERNLSWRVLDVADSV